MRYIDFRSARSWEMTLAPRYEGRYHTITFHSGAVYRVKIGAYALTLHRDVKGSRIFTLYCEGVIAEQTRIPLSAPLADYTEALTLFWQYGEELEEALHHPDQGRVIFAGDYPSA